MYKSKASIYIMYDRTLLWLLLGLISVGFIMVTSASIPVGIRLSDDPLYFVRHAVFYLCLAFIISLIILKIPMLIWQRYNLVILLVTLLMLLAVLIFGNSINGAVRWIIVGPLKIQPSELSKIAFCCYTANYLVLKIDEVRNNFWGFCNPIGVMLLLAVLLLAQPDFGSTIVLFITTILMLFIAGARLLPLLLIIIFGILSISILIIIEPYRMRRIISFWNPWDDPFGNGYQLTQSLMAFGRGRFWGQGLGNSIQKLEYLPEAHTDFIFAILGEELGYFGVLLSLIMIFLVAFRAMVIGLKALKVYHCFSGFLACSIGIWFSFQVLINIGAASGIIPTKGLTLPLISYGGSSLIVMLVAIILLIRIDFEIRLAKVQAFTRRT